MSKHEVRECERLLREFVDKYNTDFSFRGLHSIFNKDGKSQIDLLLYGRQYVPVISVEGKKLIYINCFWSKKEWRYRYRKPFRFLYYERGVGIPADDGGNSYFRMEIDLDERKVTSYDENGTV